MIADSPYDFQDLLLTPRLGTVVGMVGAGLMLGAMFLLQAFSGVRLAALLSQIGGLVVPDLAGDVAGSLVPIIGAGFHVLLGALFGLLYGACQQRAPARGLIAVGVFYGFVLWIIGGLLVGSIFGEPLRTMIRSWPWLIAHGLYGLCLAAAGIWSQSRLAETDTTIVPKD